MRKLTCIISTLILLCCTITSTYAASTEELEYQISDSIFKKAVCHQLAECARILGCEEDHTVIQFAQSKWDEVHQTQVDCQSELDQISLEESIPESSWTGPVLTKSKGINYGPQGKETYYNLPMQGVVKIMRRAGFSEDEYPYWVRNDGCKMLGPYIMIAANQSHWPLGSVVETSLGYGLVCDTGSFIYMHDGWSWIDIAVSW